MTITYTDVHRRRLRFFETLFGRYTVSLVRYRDRRGGPVLGDHHVTTGTFEAPDSSSLRGLLTHTASRLVFVLDWNRARKRLPRVLRPRCGRHRGPPLGGRTRGWPHGLSGARGGAADLRRREPHRHDPARYGEPPPGPPRPRGHPGSTQFALRVAAQGCFAGKSQLLIHDELRVEMARHVQASHRRILDAHAEHASPIVECARALQEALGTLADATRIGFLERVAQRAAAWEHRADEILVTERQAAHRLDGGETVVGLIGTADDAIDDLEEAVFLLTVVPPNGVAVGPGRPRRTPPAHHDGRPGAPEGRGDCPPHPGRLVSRGP